MVKDILAEPVGPGKLSEATRGGCRPREARLRWEAHGGGHKDGPQADGAASKSSGGRGLPQPEAASGGQERLRRQWGRERLTIAGVPQEATPCTPAVSPDFHPPSGLHGPAVTRDWASQAGLTAVLGGRGGRRAPVDEAGLAIVRDRRPPPPWRVWSLERGVAWSRGVVTRGPSHTRAPPSPQSPPRASGQVATSVRRLRCVCPRWPRGGQRASVLPDPTRPTSLLLRIINVHHGRRSWAEGQAWWDLRGSPGLPTLGAEARGNSCAQTSGTGLPKGREGPAAGEAG